MLRETSQQAHDAHVMAWQLYGAHLGQTGDEFVQHYLKAAPPVVESLKRSFSDTKERLDALVKQLQPNNDSEEN